MSYCLRGLPAMDLSELIRDNNVTITVSHNVQKSFFN